MDIPAHDWGKGDELVIIKISIVYKTKYLALPAKLLSLGEVPRCDLSWTLLKIIQNMM